MLTTFSGTVGGQVRQVLLYLYIACGISRNRGRSWNVLPAYIGGGGCPPVFAKDTNYGHCLRVTPTAYLVWIRSGVHKFRAMASNTCGYAVWSLLDVTLLAHSILS